MNRASTENDLLDSASVQNVKRRIRILMLLDASERAGIAPLASSRFHTLAYLADVLSPVWNLPAFDGKILKLDDGPHYPDLQREVDALVVLGLVEVTNLHYTSREDGGARISGSYSLRINSEPLSTIFAGLGISEGSVPLDPDDRHVHAFLVELASALGTLQDNEVDVIASIDPTYSDKRIAPSNIVDFAAWSRDDPRANPSYLAVNRFSTFLPANANLSAGERLYLYARFLRRKADARGA